MPQKDKDGKITYQMTSPGEAWMNYVNSKEGHNAAAVTPAYLEPKEKDNRTDIEKKIDGAKGKKKDIELESLNKNKEANNKEKEQ